MEILFSLAIIALIYLFLDKSHRDKLFMRTLIDSQKDLVILTSGEEIADANRRFLEFFEVPDVKTFRKKYSCICNQFIELNDGREPKKLNIEENNWISRLLSKRDSDKRIAMFDKSRGEERIFIVSISRFRNSSLFVIVFSDITEIEQEKHFFKTESMIDHLTRAYNKRTFEMHLINRISEVKHYNRENIALIMFDIDHYKQIHDQFGHSTGDKVLIEISTLVKKSLKGDNNLYRWGGEEFAILLENVVYIQAINFAERLREITSSHQFPVNRVVTCSFGVTMIRVDDTKESLIERVDANLYRAKSKGRNRVEKDIG
jgi:diguanylate cyclase (GGDEF)-like protein